MKVEQDGPQAFTVEFESEAELRAEERSSLAAGGLYLRPAPPQPLRTMLEVTVRLAGRGARTVRASVVGSAPGGLALHLEGDPAELLAALLAVASSPVPPAASAPPGPSDPPSPPEEGDPGTLWERLRNLTPPQKMLLAPKADRATRALLVQDSDPMLLFALLKNPRLSIDEVVRVAKSSFLGFQAADLILKTSQWAANLDVKVALIHNPKLPLPLALRILPTLPDNEVRVIAKGAATSNALKQAALRRVIGG